MRPIRRPIPFALFLALALGCNRSAPPAEEKTPPAPVKWHSPSQAALEEWTEFVGTSRPLPDRINRVSTLIEGRVASILGEANGTPLAEGQRVEKGTVIARLDETIVRANLASKEAQQAVSREEKSQTQLAVELAQSEVDRLKKLADQDAARPPAERRLVSPVDRLKADYALKDAESKLKGADAKLAAGLKEQEALQAQLKLHTISAQVSGRLGQLFIARGQSLSVGAAIAEIVDLSEQIDVWCYVPQSILRRLQIGQAAITGGFDNQASGAVAEGEIVYIAEQAEAETGSFLVKVRFSNKETALRANSVVRVRVLTKPGRECLSLPESAVGEDTEPPTVVIVTDVKTVKNADGKENTVGVARRLKVVLGVRDRNLHQVEIVSVEDTETDPKKKWHGEVKDALFIVEGGQGLQSGDAVKLDVEVE